MKSKKSNIKETDSILNHSRSGVYQILGHEKYEAKNLPVNFNVLNFIEKNKTTKLTSSLYEDQDKKSLSEEFKNNVLYYFVFYFLYFLILISFSILFYTSGSLSSAHLQIHLIIINLLIILSLSLLLTLCYKARLRRNVREVFLILTILTSFYFILADARVLCSLSGEAVSNIRLPLAFGLVCNIVVARYVLFDYFLYTLIIGLVNSFVFLTTQLAVSGLHDYSTLAESFIIILFNVIQISECYKVDLRIKHVFWRKEKEQMSEIIENKKNQSFRVSGINTEAELVLSTCSIISNNLKQVSKVVIYKDVKKLLKESLAELDKIKYKFVHSGFETTKVEVNPGLDDEERTFIRESFMHISSAQKVFRPPTLRLLEKQSLFPFSTYSIIELESVLSSIGRNWSFDIFFLYDSTGQSISLVSKYLLQKWSLYEHLSLNEEMTEKYFTNLENVIPIQAYYLNPYHNACHAGDVLHSLLYFLINSDIFDSLTPIELFSVIVAALGHDVGHPGLTNRYLVTIRDNLALQYNDLSVLENMHCSIVFDIGFKQDSQILKSLDPDNWIILRKMVIEMILETDMCKHFDVLAKFKTRAILLSDLNLEDLNDKSNVLSMGLKCADIAHSAKDTSLHVKWSNLVSEEFFAQGDLEKERNIPVSMFCDRYCTDIPKVQVGFLRSICLPLFEMWCGYLNSETVGKSVLEQLRTNLSFWESKRKRLVTEANKSEIKGLVDSRKRRQSHF